ncbi:MAG: type IV pilin protein [Cyanobacterium sp.]
MSAKRHEQGFTLIELLMVILVLGILSVSALPNFLNQIGKAREVEAQNVLGAINRSQQAYHWERGFFAQGVDDEDTLRLLNLQFSPKYIDQYNIIGNNTQATASLVNNNYQNDGTKAYSSGVFFNAGNYEAAVCVSLDIASDIPPPISGNDCQGNNILK